jgi:hypothetical protein
MSEKKPGTLVPSVMHAICAHHHPTPQIAAA